MTISGFAVCLHHCKLLIFGVFKCRLKHTGLKKTYKADQSQLCGKRKYHRRVQLVMTT